MKTEFFTTPKHQATKLLKKLREEKEPVLLLEGLARGEKAILEDQIISHSKAKQRMARWFE